MTTTVTIQTTRSGRVIKKPVLYEPEEVCDDDYSGDENDPNDVDDLVDSDCETDEEEDDDDEDADENGNLKGFVVDSDEEEESDEEDT